MEHYEFPEVYVKDVEGDYYIVEKNGEYRISNQCIEDGECYGHILYEEIVDKALDLVNAIITRDFIVIPRFKSKGDLEGLLVKKDTPTCLIEVKSVHPYIFVNEGDIIHERDKIAYMVTGKGEVRVYKSPCSGIVVLVINFPWEKPERYLIVVVNENDVRKITIRRD